MKKCTKCNELKNRTEFYKDISRNDGLSYICKKCAKEAVARCIAANPEQRKNTLKKYQESLPSGHYKKYDLKSRYGITLEQYNNQLDIQNNKCAICGTKSEKSLAVDHCHTTGKVRGLLCLKCNTAIGKLNDDVILLQRAIEYLNNPPYKDKD